MEYFAPSAVYAKSYFQRANKIRHMFLWNGKPISKAKWLKKLQRAGFPKSELERRFPSASEL
jgi:hypothetical protein